MDESHHWKRNFRITNRVSLLTRRCGVTNVAWLQAKVVATHISVVTRILTWTDYPKEMASTHCQCQDRGFVTMANYEDLRASRGTLVDIACCAMLNDRAEVNCVVMNPHVRKVALLI